MVLYYLLESPAGVLSDKCGPFERAGHSRGDSCGVLNTSTLSLFQFEEQKTKALRTSKLLSGSVQECTHPGLLF